MNFARIVKRLDETDQFEYLRADVRVHAVQRQTGYRPQFVDRTSRVARRHGESEFGVLLTGANELVRVRLDAGRHAHEAVERRRRADERREQGDLFEVVDDEPVDADCDRAFQFVGRLVVAVHDDASGRHAGAQHEVEFAAGRDVDAESLFKGQSRHRATEERLRREGDAVVEGARRLSTSRAQGLLVVDEEWRAVGAGESAQRDAADEHVVRR